MMNVNRTVAAKIVITNIDRLDPVTVIAEDFGPGVGKITIDCFGKAWTAFWGGMGDENNKEDFFCSCDVPYIIGKLDSDLKSSIFDADAVNVAAQEMSLDWGRDDPWNDYEVMESLYGPDMADWSDKIPKMPNPDYQYLCRIVVAVQEALGQQ